MKDARSGRGGGGGRGGGHYGISTKTTKNRGEQTQKLFVGEGSWRRDTPCHPKNFNRTPRGLLKSTVFTCPFVDL